MSSIEFIILGTLLSTCDKLNPKIPSNLYVNFIIYPKETRILYQSCFWVLLIAQACFQNQTLTNLLKITVTIFSVKSSKHQLFF